MSYVVTFADYTPPARTDELPWTHARISEAASRTGAYTTIDTIALDPLDADPTDPAERTLTTENATLTSGWYIVTFLDADGDEAATLPILNEVVEPDVSAVAALLRARTQPVLGGGADVGTFTEHTRPTRLQVEDLILRSRRIVAAMVGDLDAIVDDSLRGAVLDLIALRAAADVERSYFPEASRGAGSAYEALNARYEADAKAIVSAVAERGGAASVAGAGMLPGAGWLDSATSTPQTLDLDAW